jgi:hypothetical protein
VRWFGEQRKGRSMPRQLLWIGHCTLVSSLLATACFAIPDHGPTRDADHGRTLVNRWCVSCHLVGTDQKQATTDAPPFATIAKKPDFDAAKLALFLLNPHPKMPDMQLSREESCCGAHWILRHSWSGRICGKWLFADWIGRVRGNLLTAITPR